MAEDSRLWNTNGVGDGDDAGITTAEMNEIFRGLFAGHLGTNLGGVRPDYLNELAVTGTSSPVAVASGMAVVYGKIYINSASVNIAISTPSVNPRIDRIVLRADWSVQEIRITRIAGTENVSPVAPALTQVANTTWDIPLATVAITTGGVITVTDVREWLTLLGDNSVITEKIADLAVTTAKIAAANVTQAKMANNSVGTAQILDDNVTTAKILNSNVTTAKINDGAVTSAKIADGATLAEILDDDGAGSGLDADLLDGLDGAGYALVSHNHSGANITSGTVADARIASTITRDSEVMSIVLAADGAASTLDADLLDGVQGAGYALVAHNHTLDSLSDVSVAGKATNDFLQWNGTNWVPTAASTSSALSMLVLPLAFGSIAPGSSTSYIEAATNLSRLQFNADKLPSGATVKLYARIQTSSGTSYVELRNRTDSASITGSEVSSTTTTSGGLMVSSGDIKANLASGEKQYSLRFKQSAGAITETVYEVYLLVEW